MEKIIGAAMDVHRDLGPGLVESTYEACMLFELAERGLSVASRINLGVLCELRGESLPAQTSWPTNIHQCPWRGSGSRAERHGVALNSPTLNSCDEDEPPCCAGT